MVFHCVVSVRYVCPYVVRIRTAFLAFRLCISVSLLSSRHWGRTSISIEREFDIGKNEVREVGLIFARFLHSANDERSTASIAKDGARWLLNEVFFFKSLIQAIQRSCNSQLD